MPKTAKEIEAEIALLGEGEEKLVDGVRIQKKLGRWWVQKGFGGCTFHTNPKRAAIQARSLWNANMTPTAAFAPYVKDVISEQLVKVNPEPRDVIERRLWAAAQYDHHTKSGAICSMIDGGGLSLVDCAEYEAIINAGLKRYAEAGF